MNIVGNGIDQVISRKEAFARVRQLITESAEQRVKITQSNIDKTLDSLPE